MRLLNYTSSWFALVLFIILTIWAGIFYYNLLDEIYDSMDDGLENQKLLVIRKAAQDTSVFHRKQFDNGYYKIREIPFQQARKYTDTYMDTLIYTQNEKDFEPVRMLITAFQHNEKFYEMRIVTSMVEEDDLIEDLLFSLIVLYLGLMTSIIILNNFLLRKVWQPFYRLLERLRMFRLDDPKLIAQSEINIDEFRLLHNSIRLLLENNIQVYNNQKQFIENASHELQTPLAISLNKLELLADKYQLKDEQTHLISGAIDNLQRLTRLNKSLLLLSKISNKQFYQEAEINFNQILHNEIEGFSDLASHRNIAVSFHEEGNCLQKMNPDLAVILVANIIKNAIVHNHTGGYIAIDINQDVLRIENSGKNASLDNSKIFERFHKEEPSGSSTGLGLSIVKAITDLYGFTIQYHFKENHIITINF